MCDHWPRRPICGRLRGAETSCKSGHEIRVQLIDPRTKSIRSRISSSKEGSSADNVCKFCDFPPENVVKVTSSAAARCSFSPPPNLWTPLQLPRFQRWIRKRRLHLRKRLGGGQSSILLHGVIDHAGPSHSSTSPDATSDIL